MIAVLVGAETVLLILLSVLVAGLLRSHAEILRRLEAAGANQEPVADLGPPGEASVLAEGRRAADIVGLTLEGEAVKLALGAGAPATLLAFLSTGCSGCRELWRGLAAGDLPPVPHGGRLVIVADDVSRGAPGRLGVRPGVAEVVISAEAWEDYAVPGSPYFAYVAEGTVVGEGSAGSWAQVTAFLSDALADTVVRAPASAGRERSPGARGERADRALGLAGIGPGHPSLHPAPEPSRDA